jgi:hypothetical protein
MPMHVNHAGSIWQEETLATVIVNPCGTSNLTVSALSALSRDGCIDVDYSRTRGHWKVSQPGP